MDIRNTSRGSNGVDLDRLSDWFEGAAFFGDGQMLDSMVDELTGSVRFDSSDHDQRLGELNNSLDQLGQAFRRAKGLATRMGQSREANNFGFANELLQRVRAAVLANVDGTDGLKTGLGDKSPSELMEPVRRMADFLRARGYGPEADSLTQALEELQKISGEQNPRDILDSVLRPDASQRSDRSERPDRNDRMLHEPANRNNPDLDALGKTFEWASGTPGLQDSLLDRLAQTINFGRGARGRRLQRLHQGLDELGASTRDSSDADLINRLRSGVLALADPNDGLKTVLGDRAPGELSSQARDLAQRLRSNGKEHFARYVEQSMRQLERAFEGPFGDY